MAPALVERWLTDGYRAAEPGLSQVLVDMLRRTPDAGYCATAPSCATPTTATASPPSARARWSSPAPTTWPPRRPRAASWPPPSPRARYVELDTSHISNWERPEEFNRAVLGFLLAQ